MNRPIEGSQNHDVIIFISFGKGKEIGTGIEVKQVVKKDSFLSETMEIQTKTCTANNMNFSKEQMETLIANRKARKTEALANKSAARGR